LSLLLLALATALLAGGTRAPAAPQPAKEAVAVGTGGAVASVDPDATRAGIEILRRGGNAVDAAIAANAVLGVTEPLVAGIGGGGFMVVYLAREHRVITIDGRETAPVSFPPDAFIDPATGKPIPFFPQRVTSGMAVGVPGTLATWDEAASRFGTMPLKRLLQPAIVVARRGFVVDATLRGMIADNLTRLDAFTSSRALFLTPDREPPPVGSIFRNPELARTYKLIAHEGPGALYHGPIGAALVDAVRNPPVAPDSQLGFTVRPGVMTTGDLAAYTAPLRAPTHVTYRGYDAYGMPPPSSGGSTVGEALNILEGFDMSIPDRALALHRYLEASKLAFADRNRWVGDPDFVSVPLDGLLSKDFAGERRCLIGATALTVPVAPGDPFPPYSPCAGAAEQVPESAQAVSTNHLTVVDRYGNVVSYTTTIEQFAGSGITVPGYGFLLNNELTDFDPAPPSPGAPDPNLPAGGKRPRSSMAPTVVLHDGRPFLGVGSPGGSTIITTVLQILLDRLDFGMTLPQAVAAPRASQRNTAATTAEPDFISQYGAALQARGHSFASTPEIGAATGIEVRPDGTLQAAAEPVRRGGGSAAVVCPAATHRHVPPHGACAPVPALSR
jgi:gamma-glutamyltranspeptidase/glutathione hydrolase